jgi:hypothetical protein
MITKLRLLIASPQKKPFSLRVMFCRASIKLIFFSVLLLLLFSPSHFLFIFFTVGDLHENLAKQKSIRLTYGILFEFFMRESEIISTF